MQITIRSVNFTRIWNHFLHSGVTHYCGAPTVQVLSPFHSSILDFMYNNVVIDWYRQWPSRKETASTHICYYSRGVSNSSSHRWAWEEGHKACPCLRIDVRIFCFGISIFHIGYDDGNVLVFTWLQGGEWKFICMSIKGVEYTFLDIRTFHPKLWPTVLGETASWRACKAHGPSRSKLCNSARGARSATGQGR